MKIISIHQPNFFPWLGYFNKILRSDVFVFLDDVQFPKSGAGSWTNRVKLIISGQPKWVTGPIDRDYHGTKNINQMIFKSGIPWKEKMIKTIQLNYGKHPYFTETMPLFEMILSNSAINISEFNIYSILKTCNHLGINTNHIKKSSDISYEGDSNEMLCSISKYFNCTHYMAGSGAKNYEEPKVYQKENIKLIHQNFRHPQYPQNGIIEFITGMSIIDPLMNIGKAKCLDLLKM